MTFISNIAVHHRSRQTVQLLLFSCVVFFLLDAFFIYNFTTFRSQIEQTEKQRLITLTEDSVKKIDAIVISATVAADSIANEITAGEDNKAIMNDRLQQILHSNKKFHGGSITFKPFMKESTVQYSSSYYFKSKSSNDLELVNVSHYDRGSEKTSTNATIEDKKNWYITPMNKGENGWSEPYWSKISKRYVITYSAIFYKADSKDNGRIANGVVTIDISLAQIKHSIESLDLGPSGFGGLTTRQGNYLYHPNDDYVKKHKNLLDIAKEKNDSDRLKVAKAAANGESGILNHISTTTGERSWLIFASGAVSGWSLQNTFIKSAIKVDVDVLRQQQIRIILVSIVFMMNLLALILAKIAFSTVRVWGAVLIASLCLTSAIGAIWMLALNYHTNTNKNSVQISDKQTLDSLMNQYTARSFEKSLAPPLYIPTGINVESVGFLNANTILMNGQIWQKYPKDFDRNWKRSFEIGNAKTQTLQLIDVQNIDGRVLIRWRFEAQIRVQPDYSRYPLEVEHLKLKILPKEHNKNILLIPDLTAYKLTTSTLLPGLSEGMFIPGWELTDSFFMFKHTESNTNFGLEKNFDQEILPNLYYSIGIKRVVMDAFISNLTPLIVVAIILFSIAFLPPSIDVSRVLAICVSMFFVVVFSHLAIRKHLSIGSIFYLEYFFFVIYLTILLVPMKSFMKSLNIQLSLYEYRNNLLSKTLFWPTLLTLFLFVTAWKFY